MTAYGTEFFSMKDVNRLRILQDVTDRCITKRLAASLVYLLGIIQRVFDRARRSQTKNWLNVISHPAFC
ncbi:hypothetical protein ABR23_02150 [Enterobacter ludwigii]|nr:hypothetical protein ABR23_02150 [Enterobacter ludwigii]